MQLLSTRRFLRLAMGAFQGLLLLVLAPYAWADHIIGGDISMQGVNGTHGLFRLQLNQYWDQTQSQPGNQDKSVRLLIYRKQNPVLIESVTLNLQETLPLTFANEACAELRKLSFIEARYYDIHQFDPKKYDDPGGYYMVWERCCRNKDLTNVNGTVGVGMVFYMEFPPMVKDGKPFVNSSPDFRLPNGDYICINKPFTFDEGATDADGDVLSYKLVTPYNGYTTSQSSTSASDEPRASYPLVKWAPGYSLSTVIPGRPPLRVDPNTGQLSVRAVSEGLFLFSVECTEYRNGQVIGRVRRDMQLPVVDCSRNTPPPATVMVNGRAVSGDLPWCASQPLVLRAEKNPEYNYQWQRNGINLNGATADTLKVRESGTYTVVKSRAKVCANDTTSQGTTVTFATAPPVSLSLVGATPVCAGDTLTLVANGQPGYEYRWQRNGTTLAGEQKPSLRVTQTGQYAVLARPVGANCEGQDTLSVMVKPRPVARVDAPRLVFCPDDSVVLTATNQSGNRYSWQRDGQPFGDATNRATARQGGTYRVVVTAPNGCTTGSTSLTLTQYERPSAMLDSIAPFCGTAATVVTLNGRPAGGMYAGPGVTGHRFDPAVAGVGRHAVTYTVTSSQGCRATQSRWAVVAPGPQLSGPTRYKIFRGHSVQLDTKVSEAMATYNWSPSASLRPADALNPVANPPETTTYTLTALSQLGCPASFSVLVEVVDPLYIPSAFSPNGDGHNDTWVISNISEFPGCEVSIFTRWGEQIFHSVGYAQPWDGLYRQQRVAPEVYTYRIRTGDGPFSVVYRGQLTVLY